MRPLIHPFLICGLALILGLPLPSNAASRVALIIGIDDYTHLPDLANAGRDAQAIADQLTRLDFEVMLRRQTSRRQFYRALAEFENRLASGGTGVVYFAGHGIQSDGRNYLIPADAQIEIDDDLEAEAIDAGRILESMARSGNPLNILILDACRDNPLPRRTRSAARGLSVTSIPSGAKGTAIIYAAGEGQVAEDGPSGGHGVFTEALLNALEMSNLTLEQVIKNVTKNVVERTNGRQRPWSLASIQGDFYFNPQAVPTPKVSTAPAAAGTAITHTDIAHEVWLTVKESDDLETLRNYKKQFSDTPYALAADAKIAMLTSPTPGSQSVPAQAATKQAGQLASTQTHGPHQMVFMPTDCYLMGSEPGSPGHQSDEVFHRVCMDAFRIDRYEVTFEAYDEFARATGRDLPDDDGMGRGKHPVINVDWDDAWAYAHWVSDKYGASFRLPTEAEWEYACRGGGRDEQYCGGDEPDEVAVYRTSATAPVGSKVPNKLGIHDMSGNAWEMTCSPYYMSASVGGEQKCLEHYQHRNRSLVFRGGSWESKPHEIRASRRRVNVSGASGTLFTEAYISTIGFRLAADP